jgi:hypothetical protein
MIGDGTETSDEGELIALDPSAAAALFLRNGERREVSMTEEGEETA